MMRQLVCLVLVLTACTKEERENMFKPEYVEIPVTCEAYISRLKPGDSALCLGGGRLTLKGEFVFCSCPPFQDGGPQ